MLVKSRILVKIQYVEKDSEFNLSNDNINMLFENTQMNNLLFYGK